MKNCQRILEPVRVINPYAEYLTIPDEVLKPRRTNEHYLLAIEAIAFYKQYQRERKADENGELFIEVITEDIEEDNELVKDILLRKSDELSGSCRDYLQHINEYLQANEVNRFANREIRKYLKLEPTKQKRFTKLLLESYYIKRVQGTKSKGYEYEIVSPDEYKQLQNKIAGVLDANIEKIKQLPVQKETKKKRQQNALTVVQ